jgi:hypothetical protein
MMFIARSRSHEPTPAQISFVAKMITILKWPYSNAYSQDIMDTKTHPRLDICNFSGKFCCRFAAGAATRNAQLNYRLYNWHYAFRTAKKSHHLRPKLVIIG